MPRAQKGAGQHPCPLCNKRFTRLGDVDRHIVCMHSRERPFPCARYPHGCNFAASQKSNRKAHYKAYPECAEAAEILELSQENTSFRVSKVEPALTLPLALAAPVTVRRPRTRTRTSAREECAPYSTAARRGPPPSEASTSASTSEYSESEQPSRETSPSYPPLQLHLTQCQLSQTYYPQQQEQQQTFDLDPLSSYQQAQQPETWSDPGFQCPAPQQWDQSQYSSVPALPNEQLIQDFYMMELLSLPSPPPVDLLPLFDDPALQNMLIGTYATGNISDSSVIDVTQLGAVPASYHDFTFSLDDQADWDRFVLENPPSPSVLSSLPLIEDHIDRSMWAMASAQGLEIFVS